MPRPKGATDKKPRKRKATTPGADVLLVCEQWFRERFGRPWTPAERARIVHDLEGELSRWSLLFLVLRDGQTAATGDPRDCGTRLGLDEIVKLSFLIGVVEYTPALDGEKTAADLLKAERRTLKQQLVTFAKAAAPFAEAGVIAQVTVEAIAQGEIRKALADGRYDDAAATAGALAALPPIRRLLRG